MRVNRGRGVRVPTCLRLFSLLLGAWLVAVGGLGRVCAEAEVYRSVQTDKKQIALTFDDGPHPCQTLQILDILE